MSVFAHVFSILTYIQLAAACLRKGQPALQVQDLSFTDRLEFNWESGIMFMKLRFFSYFNDFIQMITEIL